MNQFGFGIIERCIGDDCGKRCDDISGHPFQLLTWRRNSDATNWPHQNATGLQDCNPDRTPASQKPLGMDKDGVPFVEQWIYSSVVGMLLYQASNSHPEIAYMVHQCARFTHNSKASHGAAVKRICCYVQGVKKRGLILQPSKQLTIDCYVDADFAGQWNLKSLNDPFCMKSCMGYILPGGNCPIHRISKLQTKIVASTMEVEYIALSTAMHGHLDLLAL